MLKIDGKYISTDSDSESMKLLEIAKAQGYTFEKPVDLMRTHRIFFFPCSPYRTAYVPDRSVHADNITRFADLFGDEKEELEKIVDLAMRYCRDRGFDHLAIYADNNDEEYTGKAMGNALNGSRIACNSVLKKPVKITIKDVEEKFGYPIEIVS